MYKTYAIKGEEKILVTSQNKDSLEGYKFIQEKMSEKEVDIQKFLSLEKKATETRSEYLTAELLPEGQFKDLKLQKLEAERIEVTQEYETVMQELIEKYGEGIVEEII